MPVAPLNRAEHRDRSPVFYATLHSAQCRRYTCFPNPLFACIFEYLPVGNNVSGMLIVKVTFDLDVLGRRFIVNDAV